MSNYPDNMDYGALDSLYMTDDQMRAASDKFDEILDSILRTATDEYADGEWTIDYVWRGRFGNMPEDQVIDLVRRVKAREQGDDLVDAMHDSIYEIATKEVCRDY